MSDSGHHTAALQPGEGHSLSFWSLHVVLKVTGKETDGADAIYEFTFPPRSPGRLPHRHDGFDEVFYVLEQTLKLTLDGEVPIRGPGGFAVARRGTVHNPEKAGDGPLRALSTVSPAGFEGYFVELAELAATLPPGPPPTRAMNGISRRHGVVYGPA